MQYIIIVVVVVVVVVVEKWLGCQSKGLLSLTQAMIETNLAHSEWIIDFIQ